MVPAKSLPVRSFFQEYPVEEMSQRAEEFAREMSRRRSVRDFSARPVPRELILDCLRAANTAPNGANCQPWHFVLVSDPAVKRQIREAAEAVEHEFYERRAPDQWLDLLTPLGTDQHKPFLETAPYLIGIFTRRQSLTTEGTVVKHPYAFESVGIATGILVTAIHHAGLVALPYTPSPMSFLSHILQRPATEKPFLLLVVGYPAEDATVPHLQRRALDALLSEFL
jgi:iodotyrosine deiodinase